MTDVRYALIIGSGFGGSVSALRLAENRGLLEPGELLRRYCFELVEKTLRATFILPCLLQVFVGACPARDPGRWSSGPWLSG